MTLYEEGIHGLSWSPDGSQIVFTQYGLSGLFVLDVATRNVTELPGLPSGLTPGSPVWCSDGDSILFRAEGSIYCYQIDTQETTQLTYGPGDGLGDWHPTAGLVFSSTRNCTVRWDSNIYTAAPEPPTVEVALDIKPGSCPNPLNVKSKGVLPVAILGSEDFDVGMIDVATIRLEGVAPIRSNYEDVATPVIDGQECECTTEGPDGYLDLTLKFRTQDIVDALGEVVNGKVFLLTLTGELSDETSIEGTDCIRVIKKGKKGHDDDENGYE